MHCKRYCEKDQDMTRNTENNRVNVVHQMSQDQHKHIIFNQNEEDVHVSHRLRSVVSDEFVPKAKWPTWRLREKQFLD